MDNACVIGYGMVGKATAEVFGIEKYFSRRNSNISMEEASKCRYVFICLPTPIDNEGNYFVKDIIDTIKQIDSYGNNPIYIIRSTVAPGFAMHVQKELGINTIISNPEFLSEDTASQDAKNPPFVIVGGLEGQYRDQVKGLYEARIKGAPVLIMDNTTAEMAKLALNTFFALKVVFANQLYDACRKMAINYETVKEVLEDHPYGSKNHFQIWYKGKRGVNGHCLPKDMKAFGNYTGSQLIRMAVGLNQEYIYKKTDNE